MADKTKKSTKTQQFYKRYWLQRMRGGEWGVFTKTFNSAAEFYAPSSAQWTRIETHETLEDCKRAVDFLVR